MVFAWAGWVGIEVAATPCVSVVPSMSPSAQGTRGAGDLELSLCLPPVLSGDAPGCQDAQLAQPGSSPGPAATSLSARRGGKSLGTPGLCVTRGQLGHESPATGTLRPPSLARRGQECPVRGALAPAAPTSAKLPGERGGKAPHWVLLFSALCKKMKLFKTSVPLTPSGEVFACRAALRCPGASGTRAPQSCRAERGHRGRGEGRREVAEVLLRVLVASQPACSLQQCSPVIAQ